MTVFLSKAIALADRLQRPIAIVGAIWLFISCASHIDFMMIPKVPYLTDDKSWMFAAAWNTVWWGMAYPLLDKRREEIKADEAASAAAKAETATGAGPETATGERSAKDEA
ncbi:MAG: hypothetical protein AAF291_06720 [Pseudomonadota bacterium]